MSRQKYISIIIPMYNEALVLPEFQIQLTRQLDKLKKYVFQIICIDDGSFDNTAEILILWAKKEKRLLVIELSRNFGKEAAMTCGLSYANGDAVIIIDADFQDPLSLIKELIQKWISTNAEIILAKRSDRKTDSYFKRISALFFYRIVNLISPVQIPINVGDTRLISKKVVIAINKLPEKRRFMKGLMSWVGYKTDYVSYVRANRRNGVSKFPFWKLWNFALDGIVGHSSILIRMWIYIGLTGLFLAFVLALRVLYLYSVGENEAPGYPSLMIVILFFGSIQLFCLGIFGEYISRIYQEVQQRPIYLIKKMHGSYVSKT